VSFVRAVLAGPRSQSLQGALVLALLLCGFFWTPLSRHEEVYYSSADLLQDYSPLRLEPGYPAINKLMSDEVTQMQPWSMFNRDELAQSRVPLWNPWNGTGCPHFANYQSAVFSVFTLPWYVLDTKEALLLGSFLKLYACGLFTFLFLKRLRLGQLASLVGATAFMFGGHNVLLISFPHAGAQAVLPASLYFAECALQRFERWARSFGAASATPEPRPRLRLALIGLTLALWIGLLAGQPEVFYFSFGLLAAFLTARLVAILLHTRAAAGALRRIAGFVGQLCGAGLVAAGLAAFQLLPFFEFVQNSRLFEERSHVQTPLDPGFWPLALFPNVIGNPSTLYNISYHVPPPNYELVNMAYIGGLVLLLAAVALCFARRDRRIQFFAAAGALWAVYAYDIAGGAKLLSWIPTVDLAPMNRSQGVWLMCLSALAALAVERVMHSAPKRPVLAVAGLACGALALLTVGLIGADRLIERYATFPSDRHGKFLEFVPAHISYVSELLAGGVLALSVMLCVRQAFVRGVCAAALLLLTFLGSGWLLHDYNPVTEDRLFFPTTPFLHELRARVGDERLVVLGEDKLPPDTNLPYRLQVIDNYDGMWVQHVDRLYRDQFGDTGNWRPVLRASERALKLFGVQWVLAKWGWNFVDSGLHHVRREHGQVPRVHEIVPGGTVTQTFVSHEPGLEAVAVYLSAHPHVKPTKLIDFVLEDVAAGQVVARSTLRGDEVLSTLQSSHQLRHLDDFVTPLAGRYVVFRFPAIAGSEQRTYRFSLSSTNPDQTVFAHSMPLLAYGEGRATWKDEALSGELLFDFRHDYASFQEVARIGDFTLYRYKAAQPIVSIVRGAIVAESDEEALALVRLPSFDPGQIVVLSDDARLPAEVRATLGPVDNSHRRLVKFAGDQKIYMVQEDARRLIHISNEVVFLINKFDWKQVHEADPAEFAGWPRTYEDLAAQVEAGLRVVQPEVRGLPPIEILEHSSTRYLLALQRPTPSYVVISQAWFPGWKAYVDGQETPVWRANYGFNAIAVPAGEHQIEFVYRPDSLRWGLWIGAAAALLGVLGLLRLPRLERGLAA